MKHKTHLPPDVAKKLNVIGERIAQARKRRRITMDDLASRMYVTRNTLSRLEKGDPGVSLGVMASALWVLGLDQDLLKIAVPEKDKTGLFLESRRLPNRIRNAAPSDELDF